MQGRGGGANRPWLQEPDRFNLLGVWGVAKLGPRRVSGHHLAPLLRTPQFHGFGRATGSISKGEVAGSVGKALEAGRPCVMGWAFQLPQPTEQVVSTWGWGRRIPATDGPDRAGAFRQGARGGARRGRDGLTICTWPPSSSSPSAQRKELGEGKGRFYSEGRFNPHSHPSNTEFGPERRELVEE